jgi:hypothetical protein
VIKTTLELLAARAFWLRPVMRAARSLSRGQLRDDSDWVPRFDVSIGDPRIGLIYKHDASPLRRVTLAGFEGRINTRNPDRFGSPNRRIRFTVRVHAVRPSSIQPYAAAENVNVVVARLRYNCQLVSFIDAPA